MPQRWLKEHMLLFQRPGVWFPEPTHIRWLTSAWNSSHVQGISASSDIHRHLSTGGSHPHRHACIYINQSKILFKKTVTTELVAVLHSTNLSPCNWGSLGWSQGAGKPESLVDPEENLLPRFLHFLEVAHIPWPLVLLPPSEPVPTLLQPIPPSSHVWL